MAKLEIPGCEVKLSRPTYAGEGKAEIGVTLVVKNWHRYFWWAVKKGLSPRWYQWPVILWAWFKICVLKDRRSFPNGGKS